MNTRAICGARAALAWIPVDRWSVWAGSYPEPGQIVECARPLTTVAQAASRDLRRLHAIISNLRPESDVDSVRNIAKKIRIDWPVKYFEESIRESA